MILIFGFFEKKMPAIKLNHFLAEYCVQGIPFLWMGCVYWFRVEKWIINTVHTKEKPGLLSHWKLLCCLLLDRSMKYIFTILRYCSQGHEFFNLGRRHLDIIKMHLVLLKYMYVGVEKIWYIFKIWPYWPVLEPEHLISVAMNFTISVEGFMKIIAMKIILNVWVEKIFLKISPCLHIPPRL